MHFPKSREVYECGPLQVPLRLQLPSAMPEVALTTSRSPQPVARCCSLRERKLFSDPLSDSVRFFRSDRYASGARSRLYQPNTPSMKGPGRISTCRLRRASFTSALRRSTRSSSFRGRPGMGSSGAIFQRTSLPLGNSQVRLDGFSMQAV